MTTKKTRPVKAKALGKTLRARLERHARAKVGSYDMPPSEARAILAALAHERAVGRSEGAHAAHLRIFEGEP